MKSNLYFNNYKPLKYVVEHKMLQTIDDFAGFIEIPKKDIRKAYVYINEVLGIKDKRVYIKSKTLFEKYKKNYELFKKVEKIIDKDVFGGLYYSKNIYTNKFLCAKKHRYNNFSLEITIPGFPTLIKRETLIDNFIKDFNMSYQVANLLAGFVTVNNKVVWGLPTTTKVVNYYFNDFDKYISNISFFNDAKYTRYFNKIYFSSQNEDKLEELKKYTIDKLKLYYDITIPNHFIKFNPTRICGFNVNENGISFPKKYRDKLKATIHNFIVKHKLPNAFWGYPGLYRKYLLKKINEVLETDSDKNKFEKLKQQLIDFDWHFTQFERRG